MSRNQQTSRRTTWKRIGLIAAAVWIAILGYFLLVGDPPDLWFNDIAEIEGPGHVLAGVVTGLIAYLFLARRPRPVVTALGVTIAFLVGLELLQDLLSDRGYERSDVSLSIVGAVAGVGAGWVARRVTGRSAGSE